MKNKPKILKTLNLDAVSHLEADSNYTCLTMRDGSKRVSSYNLQVFDKIFTKRNFIRINRSLMVNISFVKKHISIQGKEYLQLKNNDTVIIPRRKAERLKLDFPAQFNNSN